MAEANTFSMSDLQAEIHAAWETLWEYLERRSEDDKTGLEDAEGWTVKDHLSHLVAWERSVLALLEGQPRHVGLGVEAALFAAGDFDAINAAIQQQRQHMPLQTVEAELRRTHADLMHRLEAHSDDDLNRLVRELFPNASVGDGRSLGQIVYSNTAEHFDEHLEWIRALCEDPQGHR